MLEAADKDPVIVLRSVMLLDSEKGCGVWG